MKYDNVDYSSGTKEDSYLNPGSTRMEREKTPVVKGLSILFLVIFGGLGLMFIIMSIAFHLNGIGEGMMPGLVLLPMGIIFLICGVSICAGVRSGKMQVGSSMNRYGRRVSAEPFTSSRNPAYGASEHDELRKRVYDQARRLAELQRRCDAIEQEIRRMK